MKEQSAKSYKQAGSRNEVPSWVPTVRQSPGPAFVGREEKRRGGLRKHAGPAAEDRGTEQFLHRRSSCRIGPENQEQG